jgi:hypothetical protein
MVNHRLAAHMTFTEHDLYAPVRFARGHVWLDGNRHRNRIGEIEAVKLRLVPAELAQHLLNIYAECAEWTERADLRGERV